MSDFAISFCTVMCPKMSCKTTVTVTSILVSYAINAIIIVVIKLLVSLCWDSKSFKLGMGVGDGGRARLLRGWLLVILLFVWLASIMDHILMCTLSHATVYTIVLSFRIACTWNNLLVLQWQIDVKQLVTSLVSQHHQLFNYHGCHTILT